MTIDTPDDREPDREPDDMPGEDELEDALVAAAAGALEPGDDLEELDPAHEGRSWTPPAPEPIDHAAEAAQYLQAEHYEQDHLAPDTWALVRGLRAQAHATLALVGIEADRLADELGEELLEPMPSPATVGEPVTIGATSREQADAVAVLAAMVVQLGDPLEGGGFAVMIDADTLVDDRQRMIVTSSTPEGRLLVTVRESPR